MSNGGTQINDLINNTQTQSKEDTNVVDSIINELNSVDDNNADNKKMVKQQKPRMNNGQPPMNNGQPPMNNGQPPMTPQQQQMYQQQMYQQQMYQQHMAAQHQKMMANGNYPGYKGYNNNLTFADNVRSMLSNFKDVIIVLFVSIILNLDTFSEPLKFKDFSFFYDIQKDSTKFPAILLKGLIIAIIFSTIQYFTK